jgi:hypothetical protein
LDAALILWAQFIIATAAAIARTYIIMMIIGNLITVVTPTLNTAIGIITATIISVRAVITLTT